MNIQVTKETFKAIAQGDEKTFQDFFNNQNAEIFSIALHFTKNAFLAEEIVQEVFVSLWLSRHKLSAINDPGGYLYTTIINKSITSLKKHQAFESRKSQVDISQEPAAEVNEAEQRLAFRENESLLQNWVHSLPRKQQEVYLLKKEEGLSIKEIAEQLEISEFTVKNHLKAASRFLKEKFLSYRKVSLCLLCTFFIFFLSFFHSR